MKGQAGLREFLQKVLGVLGDVKLHPQREEHSSNCLETLEGGIFTFSNHPKKGIHISGVNEGVPDEGRDHLHVGVDDGLEGGEVIILGLKVTLGSMGGSRRELLVVDRSFTFVRIHLMMVVRGREVDQPGPMKVVMKVPN
jgi:hypothetical protein